MLAYASAAMIFATAPALPAHAAEAGSQTTDMSVETPAQQESQPASSDGSGATPVPGTNTPQTPTDATTITPLPEPAPADQGASDVTPMQSTVYAASPKGLNVRTGPSTEYGKLGSPLKYGQEITVTGITTNNWYQIQYSGSVGYVRADLVSSTPPATDQNPAAGNPGTNAAENPAAENPDTNTAETPPAEIPANDPVSESQTEDGSSEEGEYTEVTTGLLGTPVLIVLGAAIVGVMVLIGYSVYNLFKKETVTVEYGDEYYEDEQYPDEEYYEDYEYYQEEPDDGDYEDERYSDEEYYEDDQYSDEEYYEDNDNETRK